MTTATVHGLVSAPTVRFDDLAPGLAGLELPVLRIVPVERVVGTLAPIGFRPGAGPVVRLVGPGAEVLAGIPVGDALDVEGVRAAVADAVGLLEPVAAVGLELSDVVGTADTAALVTAVVGGLLDGIRGRAAHCWPEDVVLMGTAADARAELAEAALRAVHHARAALLVRRLVDATPSQMFPGALAESAVAVGRDAGLDVEVWDAAELERAGMGGVLAVGRGSERPPYLVQLRYSPAQDADSRHIVLVGKGITFDSGGLSLKSPESMMDMKSDMAGAAAVLGAMSVLRELKVPHRVTAILPLAENMPGPAATRIGDVVRSRSGITIEVLNSDFEGRVLLSDALTLAGELEPDAIVNLATLTESAVRALGPEVAALFTNDDALATALSESSARVGEPLWRMPLLDRYERQLRSHVADVRNFPGTPHARSITAALFLRRFVPAGVPWAHIDMAGPAMRGAPPEATATGFGARLLCQFLTSFRSSTSSDTQHSPEKGSRR
jgi:leucyl aminopeptidase